MKLCKMMKLWGFLTTTKNAEGDEKIMKQFSFEANVVTRRWGIIWRDALKKKSYKKKKLVEPG